MRGQSRLAGALMTAVSLVVCAADGFAQDAAPYAARAASHDELIRVDAYERPPITFSYTVVEEGRDTSSARMDFELLLDVDASTLIDEFMAAHKEGTVAARVRDGAFADVTNAELLVIGHSKRPDGAQLFSLGNRDMPYRFSFMVVAEGGRSRITVRNAVWSMIHSGIMPARVGYRPAGASEIPFRYN